MLDVDVVSQYMVYMVYMVYKVYNCVYYCMLYAVCVYTCMLIAGMTYGIWHMAYSLPDCILLKNMCHV
jgi:hypothetical protein